MKVLFAIQRLDKFGGAERAITNIANEYVKDGCQAVIMTMTAGESVYKLEDGVKIISMEDEMPLKRDVINKFKKLWVMRELIKSQKPDIVISFHYTMNLFVLTSLWGTGIPVVVSERSNPEVSPASKFKRFVRRFIYPSARGYVFQTEQARQFFSKSIQRRAAVICNSVREDLPEVKTKEFEKTITAAGRLSPEKGFDALIKAFASVAGELEDYTLNIYGEGRLYGELISLIEEYGMSDRIKIVEPSDEFHELIKNSSLFVLSSRTEGIPNVLLEALSLGIPAVATRCPCGGAELLVEDGVNGVLVDVDDVEAMAYQMKKILLNYDLMKKMSDNALKTRDKYLSENIYREWRTYTDKILKNSN